nr:hypothetical protein CTI12_AA328220 [Tanacetum cinerariifolium]
MGVLIVGIWMWCLSSLMQCPPLPLLELAPGLANLLVTDCGKDDPDLKEETKKQVTITLQAKLVDPTLGNNKWINTKNLNTTISKLNEELSDCETDLYNYKRGLSQVEARLVEFKEHEVKFCERIRGLERDVEIRDNKIKYLKNELEQVKKKKPTPSIDTSKCNKSKLQSSKFSVSEHGESSGSIMSKPMINFVKEADYPRVIKTNNTENARKSTVKYAEMYRNTSKSFQVRGNQ